MGIFKDKRKATIEKVDLVDEVREGRTCLVQQYTEKEVDKSEESAEQIWNDFQLSLSNKSKDNGKDTKKKLKNTKKKSKEKKKLINKANKDEVEYEYIYLDTDKVIDVDFNNDSAKTVSEKRKEEKQRKKEERINKIQLQEEINNLIAGWRNIMWQAKVCTTRYDTFRMDKITRTEYGWWFKVYAPKGIPLQKLDILTPSIESGLGCKFMHTISKSNEYATCFILYEGAVDYNAIPFKPVKVKPYEVFAGLTIDGKPLIMNMVLSPHIMIAGGTRRGKNGAADSILLSWINSCSEKEINLFLFQCAKIDLLKYAKCKQVKECVLEDFEKMFMIMQHIIDVEIPRRLKLFREMFSERTGENILDYNTLYPENALPYIVLVFDEFATLMFQNKGDDEVNDYKNGVLTYLSKIGSMGAAVGVFYMVMHQKPEKALCPTFIKNMTSIRICFGFDDDSPGRIVLGERDGEKVNGLPPRRAYVNNDGKLSLIYTMNLTGRRDAYIRPHEVDDKKDFIEEIREARFKRSLPEINEINKVEVDESDSIGTDNGKATIPKKKKTKDLTNKNLEQAMKKEEECLLKEQIEALKNEIGITKNQINSLNLILESSNKEKVEYKVSDKAIKKEKNTNNEVNDTKKERKKAGCIEINKVNSKSNVDIQKEIEEIVAKNAKNNPNWVPYEPKEGDKVIDLDKIGLLKGKNIRTGGR